MALIKKKTYYLHDYIWVENLVLLSVSLEFCLFSLEHKASKILIMHILFIEFNSKKFLSKNWLIVFKKIFLLFSRLLFAKL